MIALETRRWKTPAVVRTALVFAFTCVLAGNAAVAQPQKPQGQPQQPQGQRTGQNGLQLNDREYFETRGLNVLVFTNEYNGMFFDEKTAGIEIIQHGVRTGHRRRGPPVADARAVGPDPEGGRAEGRQGHQHHHVRAALRGLRLRLAGSSSRPRARASASPSTSTSRCPRSSRAGRGSTSSSCRRVTSSTPTWPTASPASSRAIPIGPTDDQVRPTRRSASSRATRPSTTAAGTSTSRPTRSPPARRSSSRPRIRSAASPSRRSPATSSCSTGATSRRTAGSSSARCCRRRRRARWRSGWSARTSSRTGRGRRSSASRRSATTRRRRRWRSSSSTRTTRPLQTASLFEVTADGAPVERLKAKVQPWGTYLRYKYVTADFSAVDRPGLYFIQYGTQKTETFPIGPNVYDTIWHATLGRVVPGADGPHDRSTRPTASGTA